MQQLTRRAKDRLSDIEVEERRERVCDVLLQCSGAAKCSAYKQDVDLLRHRNAILLY